MASCLYHLLPTYRAPGAGAGKGAFLAPLSVLSMATLDTAFGPSSLEYPRFSDRCLSSSPYLIPWSP